jgi:mono/diheme cytochrome c family protein
VAQPSEAGRAEEAGTIARRAQALAIEVIDQMRRIFRWIGIVAAALVIVVLLGAATVAVASWRRISRVHTVNVMVPRTIPTDAAAIERGKHLATAMGSCTFCHGPDLGGQMIQEPSAFATLAAPNLTRGSGGLGGTFTDTDWVRAIRHGIHRDGTSLLVMPSEAFVFMNETDLGDLIAYLKQLPAVDREMPLSRLGPLGRTLLVAGQVSLITDRTPSLPYPPIVPPGPTPEYGRYLAGYTGCIGCHGPGLSGGHVEGPPGAPPAANITPDPSGLANWTETDFDHALRRGVRKNGTPIDIFMPWPNYSGMTDVEVKALWLYVSSVPAKPFGNR